MQVLTIVMACATRALASMELRVTNFDIFSTTATTLYADMFGIVVPVLVSGSEVREFNLVLDTGSNASFLREGDMEPWQISALRKSVRDKFKGRDGVSLPLIGEDPEFYPQTVHGILGFGGSGMGSTRFALVPLRRLEFEYIDDPVFANMGELCAGKTLHKAVTLDSTLLETTGRWVVSGYVALMGAKSVATKLEIDTGAHGIELPPVLYSRVVDLIKAAGIDPQPAEGAYSGFLKCFNCYTQLASVVAKIMFQTSLSHSLVNLIDPIYQQDRGQFIFAVKPSAEPGIVRVGSHAIHNWVLGFDRPNLELWMCSRK